MVNYNINKTCCFLGHRRINITNELKFRLKLKIEELITCHNVSVFLFGSRSQFEDLCYDIVTDLKQQYNLDRVYVRAEYKNISVAYETGLLKSYEYTYYPSKLVAGAMVYIKRNEEMIDKSKFCIFYYNKKYVPTKGYGENYKYGIKNSGTELSYKYAIKKKKIILNFYESNNE